MPALIRVRSLTSAFSLVVFFVWGLCPNDALAAPSIALSKKPARLPARFWFQARVSQPTSAWIFTSTPNRMSKILFTAEIGFRCLHGGMP
jgi:hypothetical protein